MATKYQTIRQAIKETNATQERAIKARFQNDPEEQPLRKLWPLVLGQDANGEDVALCYQYGGYSPVILKPHVNNRNLRCMKLSKLSQVEKIVFNPATEGFDPPVMKFRQVKKQTCVEDVDVYRQAD
jgi:hypothetical protein